MLFIVKSLGIIFSIGAVVSSVLLFVKTHISVVTLVGKNQQQTYRADRVLMSRCLDDNLSYGITV